MNSCPSFPTCGRGGNAAWRRRSGSSRPAAAARRSPGWSQYFEGISPETWAFTIGGYRPVEKWLKDRKGRTLSFDGIAWYRRICAVLAETPRVMDQIDVAITKHGGWPFGAAVD